ncbi:MAG: hypothetical protein QOI98_539 [Solirubrobacteraceae bacterium]|nr:hypothetical protein [Solirubrobacteraceae bacterium]
MPSKARPTVICACLALALIPAILTRTAFAAPAPRQIASVKFSSPEPGVSTGVEWWIDYRNPDDRAAKPPAVAETIAAFPPGSRIDTSAPVQCKASDAELTLDGPSACPTRSRVATGKLDVDTGSLSDAVFPRVLHNHVTNFNNAAESIIFTQSTNMPGAQTRTVTRARVRGNTITTDVPPLPGTPPPDPYLALKRFRLFVAPLTRAGASYVTTPASCPRSRKWIFTLTFVYRDGVRQVVTSASPCVPRPRLRLSVSPRWAVAERPTRFRFLVTRPDGAAAAGAIVSLGHHRARTGRRGRARLVVRLGRTGRYRARARLPGFRRAVGFVQCEADE